MPDWTYSEFLLGASEAEVQYEWCQVSLADLKGLNISKCPKYNWNCMVSLRSVALGFKAERYGDLASVKASKLWLARVDPLITGVIIGEGECKSCSTSCKALYLPLRKDVTNCYLT